MSRNVSHLERSDCAEGEDDDENNCTGAEEDPRDLDTTQPVSPALKTHWHALRSAVYKGAFRLI